MHKCYTCGKPANRLVRWMGHDGAIMDISQCPEHGLLEPTLEYYDPVQNLQWQLDKVDREIELLRQRREEIVVALANKVMKLKVIR